MGSHAKLHANAGHGKHSYWKYLSLLFLALFVLSSPGWGSTAASAQTPSQMSYWLGRPTDTEYIFETRLPADFAAMLTATGPKYANFKNFPKPSSHVINGKTYNFVTTEIAWDNDLIDRGTVAFAQDGTVQQGWWFTMDPKSAEWSKVAAHMKAQATVNGTWKNVKLMVFISPDTPQAPLQLPLPTYWLARPDGTEYVFDTRLPVGFGDMLTATGPQYTKFKNFPKPSSHVIDGKTYNVVTTEISWDKEAIDNGRVAFAENGTVQADWWVTVSGDPKSETWKKAVAQIKAQATVSGAWKGVKLMVFKPADAAQATLRLPIPEATLLKTKMAELGKSTANGKYYSQVKVPANLDAFRTAMLDYGNMGRRDPNFRKNNAAKSVVDLSGDTVKTIAGVEKVYKHYKTAPYFKDHVLNAKLNQAAQFQAEYVAANKITGLPMHKGPNTYTDPSTNKRGTMVEPADRSKFFGGPSNVVEAAAIAGVSDLPHGWMVGDTHFRPWFNVSGDHSEVGYGAAMGSDGRWYFVAVATIDQTPIVAVDIQPQIQKDYGFLYNAYAAKSATICPTGWQVPTQADFQALIDGLKPDAHLKLSDPAFWGSGTKATNASGFSARPAGGVNGDIGGSYDFGKVAHFWSTSERAGGENFLLLIHANDAGFGAIANPRYGFSIRCINRDASASATSVQDADGNTYKTVQVGKQLWMAENLRTTKFSDGKAIPLVSDSTQWSKLSNAAYTLVTRASSK